MDFSHIENLIQSGDNAIYDIGGKDIILFGAGFYGQATLEYLTQNNYKVIAFSDNDIIKQGSVINGIPCIPPSDITKFSNSLVVISIKYYSQQVSQQLDKMNIKSISFDAFLIREQIDNFREVYNLLDDELSKQTFITLLEAYATESSNGAKKVYVDNQYFCLEQFNTYNPENIYVDCGAFVGDTIEKYINIHSAIFKKIYAFEPGERQFNALKIRTTRLLSEWALFNEDIECVFGGVGKNNTFGTTTFTSDLFGTRLIEKDSMVDNSVPIYSLDSYLKDTKVTILKADIEGYEMDMLNGACNLIKREKPNLAISIYHKLQDFYEIPLYIKSLVPEYKLAIRHHSKSLMETCLYCYL